MTRRGRASPGHLPKFFPVDHSLPGGSPRSPVDERHGVGSSRQIRSRLAHVRLLTLGANGNPESSDPASTYLGGEHGLSDKPPATAVAEADAAFGR